jgi:hypothetical protein
MFLIGLNSEGVPLPLRAVLRALRLQPAIAALGAIRSWHLDKGTVPNGTRPFAFRRSLCKLSVIEEFAYSLSARVS